jgi:hypothetical protein
MRYGLVGLVAAMVVIFAFTSAFAQGTGAQTPPTIQVQKVPVQCPPGVAGPCWQLQYQQGGLNLGSGPRDYIAHSPVPAHPAVRCAEDSDCPPGPGRCLRGHCMRMTMGCNSESDCKFSEVCDTSHPSRPFAGLCVPRGGHY